MRLSSALRTVALIEAGKGALVLNAMIVALTVYGSLQRNAAKSPPPV
jgi:hypothetical protein